MNDRLAPEQSRLHAYVDGQLDGDTQREVEEFLTSNSEAREQVEDYQRINDLLRQHYDPVLDEPVPDSLRIQRRPRINRPVFFSQMAAAIAILAIGLVSGLYLGLNLNVGPVIAESEADHIVGEVVAAYSIYTPEVHHPIEVPGSQKEYLVAWLSKRMGRQIIAPQLNNHDMRLLGGRLLAFDDGPGALLMYEDPHGQRIVFYACHSSEKSSAFHYAKQEDVSVFYWVDSSITYAIAGEIEKERLRPMAEAVYNQLLF